MNVRLTSAGVDRVGTLVLGLQPKKNGKGNPNRRGYSASSLAATGRLNNTGRSLSNAEYTSHLQVKDQRSIAAADCSVIDHEFHHQHALSNSLLLSDRQQHHDRESLSIIARSILLSDCCMGSDRSLSCG